MKMARRQTTWAAEARRKLETAYGSACQQCGSQEKLQFHVTGQHPPAHHHLGTKGRVSFYRKMSRLGRLRLLCASCHARTHLLISVQILKPSIIKACEQGQQLCKSHEIND